MYLTKNILIKSQVLFKIDELLADFLLEKSSKKNEELWILIALLSFFCNKNYSAVDFSQLAERRLGEIFDIEEKYANYCIPNLQDVFAINSDIIGDKTTEKPIIFDNNLYYLYRYFVCEKVFCELIKELQEKSLLKIITGGPGTGKTTSVAQILEKRLSKKNNLKIQLLAPTGKACDRLNSSINNYNFKNNSNLPENAVTLHNFFHHRISQSYDVAVIDEASMISLEIFTKTFSILHNSQCEIILLGDENQLSSIENGAVLSDLLSSKFLKDSVEYKTKSWRFDNQKGIGKLAYFVNNFTQNSSENLDKIINENPEFITWIKEKKAECFVSILTKKIGEYKAALAEKKLNKIFEILNSFRVLCATNQGEFGVDNLNNLICKIFFQNSSKENFHGKAIMITKNNYELQLMNGDVGILFEKNPSEFVAIFPHKDREFTSMELPEFYTAFAMTIHKSQGSEFDEVFLILPPYKTKITNRELLYTGITRAKTHITILADKNIFLDGCSEKSIRFSGITSRLMND